MSCSRVTGNYPPDCLYDALEQYHPLFEPGPHPSIVDIGIYSTGAGLALLIMYVLLKPNLETQKSSLSKGER